MTQCPRCGGRKLWVVQRSRRRCAQCRYTFTPHLPSFRLSSRLLRHLVTEFVLEHSTNTILQRARVSRGTLLKLLTRLRMAMKEDVPTTFTGVVEVDETYLGGQWKNKRKPVRQHGTKRGRGTSKQPVFGILCRNGQVWAHLVAGVESADLQPLIEARVRKGSTVCSDGWRGYTGIATKGYVHRLVDHAKGEYSDRKGGHINGLEGFWGYLKRKLMAKGGIRHHRLPLYLAEYAWRFNHRGEPIERQVSRLLRLLSRPP